MKFINLLKIHSSLFTDISFLIDNERFHSASLGEKDMEFKEALGNFTLKSCCVCVFKKSIFVLLIYPFTMDLGAKGHKIDPPKLPPYYGGAVFIHSALKCF